MTPEEEQKEKLLEQVNLLLPSIHGWTTQQKARKLVDNIVHHKPDLVVEIGVFGGSSLIVEALALKMNKKGVVYGIDPWANDACLEEMNEEASKKWWGELNLEDIYQHCQKNVTSCEVQDYCKLIRAKSADCVEMFESESISLLMIDGNHSEFHSYQDVTLYLPKVKKGGFVFFDDIYWTENQEVTTRKAVLYLFEYCKKVDIVDDCLIFQKT